MWFVPGPPKENEGQVLCLSGGSWYWVRGSARGYRAERKQVNVTDVHTPDTTLPLPGWRTGECCIQAGGQGLGRSGLGLGARSRTGEL